VQETLREHGYFFNYDCNIFNFFYYWWYCGTGTTMCLGNAPAPAAASKQPPSQF
jgi:hypothetical protein